MLSSISSQFQSEELNPSVLRACQARDAVRFVREHGLGCVFHGLGRINLGYDDEIRGHHVCQIQIQSGQSGHLPNLVLGESNRTRPT